MNGYHGLITTATDGNKSYISECIENIDCDFTVSFSGLSPQFKKFSLCYQCNVIEKIPFIPLYSTDNKTFEDIKGYTLNKTTWTELEDQKSSLCLLPIAESFNIQT